MARDLCDLTPREAVIASAIFEMITAVDNEIEPDIEMSEVLREEMLRRSIADGSEDYVSFRDGKIADHMEWSDDRLRSLNEPARRP